MNKDYQIIQKCLLGEQLAFKSLYERHVAYCYGICKRYGVMEADLKDQVQVIFTEVFKSLEQFNPEKASFRTWFVRVSVNQILKTKRKYKNKVHTEDISLYENRLEDPAFLEDFEEFDKEYFLQLFDQMPDKFREAFNMFVIDGYSHKEIAEKLNLTEGNSRVMINRARKWLKKTITKTLVY